MNQRYSVGIHLITPVWGEVYTQCFVDVCLPSLLADGNIPALHDLPNCAYNIYTTPEDRETIEASPAYKKLATTIPVAFHSIRAVRGKITNQYVVQSEAYRHGIAVADAVDAAMVFINSDIVLANGGIASLLRIARSGKRAILALGFRINKEAVVPELVRTYRSASGDALSIEPKDLAKLALPNLHAISKAHLYHGEGDELHPAGLFWRVGEYGMLARCFHLHPILVHPRNKNADFSTTIDEDYLNSACPDPEDAYVITDSDEFCACELSDAARRITTMPRTEDRRDIARWAFFNANKRHRQLVRESIRIHAEATDTPDWARVQLEADEVVTDVLQSLGDPGLFGEERPSTDYGTLPSTKNHLPIYFATPVWGKEYTETFVSVTLPSILSLGNIPAVPNKSECRYIIYSDAVGRHIIERSRAYGILREYVDTEIRLITEVIENKYVTSSNCYREVVQDCAKAGTAAVFLIPDMILSDGSIRFLANVLQSGKRQVLITGIRLVKETAVPEVLRDYSAGGVISVSAPDLIRLALNHLHPITRNHFYGEQSEYFHPAGMYWRVGNEGLVLRCFHLHPVALVPNSYSRQFTGTIDDDLLEASAPYDKDIYVVTNSDEVQWCEISNLASEVPTPRRVGTEAIAAWMENNTSAFHRSLIHNTIRVHTGKWVGPLWTATQIRAETAVREVLACFDIIQRSRVAGERAQDREMTLRILLWEAQGLMQQMRFLARQFVTLAEQFLAKGDKSEPQRMTDRVVAKAVVNLYRAMRFVYRGLQYVRRRLLARAPAPVSRNQGMEEQQTPVPASQSDSEAVHHLSGRKT